MPRILTTARHRKPLELTIRKNSSSNEEKEEDLGMFHMNRKREPSLPSLSNLLSTEVKETEEPKPRIKVTKSYGKKDIFVGKNLKDSDHDTSPMNNSRKKRNEFDISHMFNDGLSDEDNNAGEFSYVANSQDSDTEATRAARAKREARSYSNRRSNNSIKSAKTAAETSTSGLGRKKNDFGTADQLHRSKKPRIIENLRIVEPFVVRVEEKRGSPRANRTIEIIDDFKFDESYCSSVNSANLKVDSNDFSNQPLDLKFGEDEFVDKTNALIDSEMNLSRSSYLKESRTSSPGKISSQFSEGFELAPRYVMIPECKSPFIGDRKFLTPQKDAGNKDPDRDQADSDFSYDSEISQYSEIFTQPSEPCDDLIKIGSQLSGLSKISSPMSEEFKMSPRYAMSRDCDSPFRNAIFNVSQSQYLQQRRPLRNPKKTDDATMFRFKLCDSVATEIGESSQLPLAKSNSVDSLKRRRPLDTNVKVFNVEINNTYNGCDRGFDVLNCSNAASQRKKTSASEFYETSRQVQSFVSEWLNNQDESGDFATSKSLQLDEDEDMFDIKENLSIDPESLFSNYSCEYTEASLTRRLKPMQSDNNFGC